MTEKEFLSMKPGDMVVCTKTTNYSTSFIYGNEYEIRDQPQPNCSLTIALDSNGNTENGWSREFFEPADYSDINDLYNSFGMEARDD